MSQYVGQRVTCRVQAGNFDLLLTCLAEPDKGMPVGCRGAGTKIHVVGSFGRLRLSNLLYVRRGEWGGRRSSNCRDTRFHRRFGGSVLLLMISARHKLLCATSANSQANRGRKHADPNKGLQADLLLIRYCHLHTLINLSQPMSPARPTVQYARVCEPEPSAANGRRCMRPRGSSGYPLVTRGAGPGALPMGYLPTGVLPTGYLPRGNLPA